MRVPFAKLSPSGNTTILLRGQFTPQERAALSMEVLQQGHLEAEQAGTICPASSAMSQAGGLSQYSGLPRLDMMGGEFCLNATRAFAALLALEGKLEGSGPDFHGEVLSSGLDTPVAVRVRVQDEATAHAAVRLHLPVRPEPVSLEPGVWLVRLPGIAHLLLDQSRHPLSGDFAADAAGWRQRFGLECEPAVGVVRTTLPEHRHMRIVPVVWVALTNGVCLETACGSGSLAAALLGMTLAAAHGGEERGLWRIEQAGGILDVTPSQDEYGFAAWVGGDVRLIAVGDTFVPDHSAAAVPPGADASATGVRA